MIILIMTMIITKANYDLKHVAQELYPDLIKML